MSYLLGLLAFAAVMIVLATLVTVVVEALHTLARLRQKHFRSLLEAVFRQAVRTRAWPGGDDGGSAASFVDELLANPALDGVIEGRSRLVAALSRIPLLGRLFDTGLRELDTRQFIEQLAYSRAGRALAAQADGVLQSTLDELAREYERLGQAASAFFTERARALSLLVAVLIAVVVNVDALTLYSTLVRDRQLAAEVTHALDVEQLVAAQSEMANGESGDADTEARDAIRDALGAVTRERERLAELGLPVGKRYFPYCILPAGSVRVDLRCPREEEQATTSDESATSLAIIARLFTPDGLGWMLSTMIAAGLIGLGAPFWFRVYRAVGSLLPGLRAADKAAGRVPDGTRPQDSNSDEITTSPVALLRAFRTAARSAGGGQGHPT